MVLIYLSLAANEVELLSISLLAIWIPFNVKSVLQSFAHFSVGLPFFFLLSCRNSLFILGIRYLLEVFFFLHLYWSIIALQWCVSFCFITK